MKYSTLKLHIEKLKKTLEEDRDNKDDLKKQVTEEFKNVETGVKVQLKEQNENLKTYSANLFQKLETSLMQCEKSLIKDNDIIKKNIEEVREYIDIDMPSLNEKLDQEAIERNSTLETVVGEMNSELNRISDIIEANLNNKKFTEVNVTKTMQTIMSKAKDEFDEEKNQREKFEENIFKMLEETTNQLSKIK